MLKHIKKGDILLLVIFIAAAVLIAGVPLIRSGRRSDESNSTYLIGNSDLNDDQVVIIVGGEQYGIWPLGRDQVIDVRTDYGFNEVTISEMGVSVTKSDCVNQICVDTGTIRQEGQMIVCLPHRLIVEIRPAEGSRDSEYDAIAH